MPNKTPKRREVKGWAVVDAAGTLLAVNKGMVFWFKEVALATTWPEQGERVVPVVVTYEVPSEEG